MRIANIVVLATLFGLGAVDAVQLNNKLRMKNRVHPQGPAQLMQTKSMGKMRNGPPPMMADQAKPGFA
jgi:hypothetical protein